MANPDFIPLGDDFNLDDIDDLPSFLTPIPGAYLINLPEGLDRKMIGDHPAVVAKCVIKELTEVKPIVDEMMPKIGDEFSLNFMTDNEFGAGKLKEFLAAFAEKFGTKKWSDLQPQTKGIDILLIMDRRWSKKDEKYFPDPKKVIIP